MLIKRGKDDAFSGYVEDEPMVPANLRDALVPGGLIVIAALLDADELPNSRSTFLFNVLNARIFLEESGP